VAGRPSLYESWSKVRLYGPGNDVVDDYYKVRPQTDDERRESVRRLESLRTDMRTACDAYRAVAQREGR